MFLKTYETEDVLCTIAGTDRKSFRKWAWIVVVAIAAQAPNVVSASDAPHKLIDWF